MEKRKKEETESEETDEDTICGIGSFRPQWIQRWAIPKVYFVLFCIVGIIQGSHYTYFIGIITTLEKRFAFSSKVSNTLLLVEEFSILILGTFVGYFGGNMHRPRVLATGMFLSVSSCLVAALPYFIYGSAQHLVFYSVENEIRAELCDSEFKKQQCDSNDRPPTVPVIAIFCISILLKGVGTTAYYTIGVSYMDDNAKKKDTPVYFALFKSLRILGPLLGFLLSSAFLSLYENPFVDPGFGPDDPRWIGAWWIGFILVAFLLFIFSIPLLLFPRSLPSQARTKETNNNAEGSVISQLSGTVVLSYGIMKMCCDNTRLVFCHFISCIGFQ